MLEQIDAGRLPVVVLVAEGTMICTYADVSDDSPLYDDPPPGLYVGLLCSMAELARMRGWK